MTTALTVIQGGLPHNLNANDPADHVRAEAIKVGEMLHAAEQLADEYQAAEDRARQFKEHYLRIRDAHKSTLSRLLASVPPKT